MNDKERIAELETRVRILTEEKRAATVALEQTVGLGSFDVSLNQVSDVGLILRECAERINKLARFEIIAFHLVDESDQSFRLAFCDPEDQRERVAGVLEEFIQDNTFSWAVSNSGSVFVSDRKRRDIMLHVLATTSRVRGMFIGWLGQPRAEIQDVSHTLMSVVFRGCAHLLESQELYRRHRETNAELMAAVAKLERSEQELLLHKTDLENQVNDSTQARKRSSELLEAIIQHATVVIFLKDAQGHILRLNPAAERFLGLSQEDALGKTVHDIFPPELARAFHEQDRHVIATGMPLTGEDSITLDGKTNVFLKTLFPIPDEQGRVYALGGMATNISDRIRMEQELRLAKEASEAANEAKTQFLANMSHELRTPLNGIIGMTELLLENETEEEPRELLGMMLQSSRQLMTILSDLLELARIETKQLGLNVRPFSLRQALTPIIKSLALQAELKGLEFYDIIDENVPDKLLGDPDKLRRVCINIVSNAIKFTSHGLVRVVVRLDPRPPRSTTDRQIWLLFAVSDTGVGIPADKLESIFDRFTLAEDFLTKRHGGTGLGLPIARELVQLQGGGIQVESEEGRGSVFTFRLPFETIVQVSSEADEGLDWGRLAVACALPLRVLLLDEEPTSRIFVQRTLERCGHEVILAEDGDQAEERLKKGDINLLVLDVRTPGFDCLDLTQRLRAGELGPNSRLPVIGLSSKAKVEEEEQCLRAGVSAFISKPFRMETLIRAIARLGGA